VAPRVETSAVVAAVAASKPTDVQKIERRQCELAPLFFCRCRGDPHGPEAGPSVICKIASLDQCDPCDPVTFLAVGPAAVI